MNSNQKYIATIVALFMAGTALFVWREEAQALLADQIETAPIDISGVWRTDDTQSYLIHTIEGYEGGHAYGDGHEHFLRRAGWREMDLNQTEDGYIYGSYTWAVGTQGEDPIYTGIVKVLGVFENDVNGDGKDLSLINSVTSKSKIAIMQRLTLIDERTLHGTLISVSGPQLVSHVTYHRVPELEKVSD